MKILLVVHYFLPHIGGMETVVERQAKSLVERGHEVTVLTCRPSPQAPLSEMKDGYRIERIRAINAVENKFGVTFPIIAPWAFWRFMQEVKAHDIIHIHDVFYMSSHMAGIASVLRKKKFFLTQHVAMVDHPSGLVMMIQRMIYVIFGRLLFKCAEKIVSYNRTVRKFLMKNGASGNKILTQYNGINTSYFMPVDKNEKRRLRTKYKLPVDRPVALFVGRLVPKKGYEIVYDAQSDDHFTLIVGSGVRPERIVSNKNVRLFGAASESELRDLYALSDVFVFPAIGEIFTLVMQEAMSTGLPIVTTNDPGYASYDFSRENIQLVERNSDAFRRALAGILMNEERLGAMSEYSRMFALEYFDWQRNYEDEYKLYGLDPHKETA